MRTAAKAMTSYLVEVGGKYVCQRRSPSLTKEILMSIIDKVVAAVTPTASDEERMEARSKAQAAATKGSWLAMVLGHHQAIEQAFASVKSAESAIARRYAQKALAGLLTGHSLAEEAVLYPALATNDHKTHSEMAYVEQSAAKVQLAALEELDPMSQDYLDKLEHIRGAVAQHVYQEESTWFPELVEEGDATLQARLTARYQEEFSRYSQKPVADFPGMQMSGTVLGDDTGASAGTSIGTGNTTLDSRTQGRETTDAAITGRERI